MTAPDELQRLAGAAAEINAADWWVSEGTLEDVRILDKEDREFIAAANPATILALLSERAELLAAVERMRAALWPFAQVKPTAESGFVNICALNVDVIAARAALTTGEEK